MTEKKTTPTTGYPSELAMNIAVVMEVHAACGTTTKAKGVEIDSMLTPLREQVAAQAKEIERKDKALREAIELADQACVNTESALDLLAQAGRPQLADMQRDFSKNIRKALSALTPAAQEADHIADAGNMVLVPRDPTEAMLDAFAGVPFRTLSRAKQEAELQALRDFFAAASPSTEGVLSHGD